MRIKPAKAWFLAGTAVFAVLAGFVFWGTWSTNACPVMPDSPMFFREHGYIREFICRFVETGRFNPYDITRFIGSPYLWQEMLYVMGGYFSMLGLAYYLRGRGISNAASYGAGLLLAFCGYWFSLFSAGHGGWFYWMIYGVFAFGLIDRAIRKNKLRHWVMLGACVAWASFYQPDLWLLETVLTGAYFIWCIIRERKLPDWRGVAVAAATLILVGAPSFSNALFHDLAARDSQIEDSKGTAIAGGSGTDDAEARWIFATNWSLPPNETLEFLIPRINGDTSCPMVLSLGKSQGSGVRPYTGALGRPYGAPSGNYRQHSLYVGFATCLLAVLAIFNFFAAKRRKDSASERSDIAFFAVAALCCYVFSLGRYCEPVYRVIYALPFGDYLRAPVKWHHATELCICALAGFGLEALYIKLSSIKRINRHLALGLVCAVSLAGAFDLARIDKLYCAVVDLDIVQHPNPAAEKILSEGGGKLADFIQGGNGLVDWSFRARGIETPQDMNDKDIRFALTTLESLKNPRMIAMLKSRNASLLGSYSISQKSIREGQHGNANAALFKFRDIPPPEKEPDTHPPVSFITWLGAVSILSSIAAAAYTLKRV